MQFPKRVTKPHVENVENKPLFNALTNIRETKLHARFLKSMSFATGNHSWRERRSQREGETANEGEATDERVNTGPNGAARNYARIHTHEAQNICMVGLAVR